jgi:hypothetical protein
LAEGGVEITNQFCVANKTSAASSLTYLSISKAPGSLPYRVRKRHLFHIIFRAGLV